MILRKWLFFKQYVVKEYGAVNFLKEYGELINSLLS